MLAVVLFISVLGAVLLIVAILALRRQVRLARRAIVPIGASVPGADRRAKPAPIISAPLLDGSVLTIGRATRDLRSLLLVFVEPGSTQCESVVDDAVELCRAMDVRLLLVGDDEGGDYDELVRRTGLQPGDCILSSTIRDDFMIGPVPSAALINAEGHLVATGTVQRREHLEVLLLSGRVSEPGREAV